MPGAHAGILEGANRPDRAEIVQRFEHEILARASARRNSVRGTQAPVLRDVARLTPSVSCRWGAGHQTTLAGPARLQGTGLHSGERINLTIRPAAADTGIVFRRTDLGTEDRAVTDVSARYDNVCDTTLCTVLANDAGTMVGTVEHLMAALAGLGVDNAVVEVDGSELPVMDGSSAAFVAAIEASNIASLNKRRRAVRILKPVKIEDGVKSCELVPGDGFSIDFEIDFENPVIGHQMFHADLADDAFRREICRARTFGFLKDVEAMWAAGLARGGSLENAVMLDGESVLNADGLRYADEFVRHKVLDAVGDLALAGAPIVGGYRGTRAGHAMNNQVLRALFADPQAWEFAEIDAEASSDHRPASKAPLVAVSAD